jgi:hypothetical protein
MEPETQEVQEELRPSGEETPVESVEVAEEVESDTTEELSPAEPGAVPQEKKKSGVQERFDEITREKYDAMRDRDYWKERAEARLKAEEVAKPAPVLPPVAMPRQEDFETYEAYDEALFDARFQQRVAREQAELQRQQQTRQAEEQQERSRTWAEKGSEKYPDFANVALREPKDGGPMISQFMAGAIQDSETGHEIAYYLGQNPKESARIAKLPPISQVREIGRLEFKVQSPKQRETTKAPAPTAPVGGKDTPSVKLEDMNYAEYKAYRERQIVGGK